MLREPCALRVLISRYALDAQPWQVVDLVRGRGAHFAAHVQQDDRCWEHVHDMHARKSAFLQQAAGRKPAYRRFSASAWAHAASDSGGPPNRKLSALPFRVRGYLRCKHLRTCSFNRTVFLMLAKLMDRSHQRKLHKPSSSITIRTSF